MNKYKYLYFKYKNKYLNLKNKYNIQNGGTTDFKNIIKQYQNIPITGLYEGNISKRKFKEYCQFLKRKTENEPEIIDFKKKIKLERDNKTNTDEYIQLIKKINNKGKEYQKKGHDFETLVYQNITQYIASIKKKSISNLKLLRNPKLYILDNTSDSESWILIGEIDGIILEERNIIAIAEIKKAFDDIPDAFFQIKRSYQAIQERNNIVMKLITDKNKEIILDSTFNLPNSLIESSFIFTNKPENILNIQSKIKFSLIYKLHAQKKVNYDKLFKKIINKKNSLNKLNNTTILRYNTGVLELLKIFKKHLHHIKIY